MSVAARVPRAPRRRGGRAAPGGGRRSPGSRSSPGSLLAPGDGHDTERRQRRVPLGTAAVERRDLVDREDVDGTLGFAGHDDGAAPAAGTITRLRDEGDTVTRGRSLMSIDAKATAWVLYGTLPMYRDLGPGVTDGRDVRQLERNLEALGYDPGTVDDDWTSATTAAVESTSRTIATSPRAARCARGEVVFRDGPARVGKHSAEVGDPARAGAPVAELTSTTPVVTAKLDAGLAAEVHRGDARQRHPARRPRGRRPRDRASARSPPPARTAPSPTVELRVALNRGRRGRLDQAPVDVSLRDRAHEGRARGAGRPRCSRGAAAATRSSSPGTHRLVRGRRPARSPTTGSRSTGSGLAPGTRVVVPR